MQASSGASLVAAESGIKALGGMAIRRGKVIHPENDSGSVRVVCVPVKQHDEIRKWFNAHLKEPTKFTASKPPFLPKAKQGNFLVQKHRT
jgi:hypothetical protein